MTSERQKAQMQIWLTIQGVTQFLYAEHRLHPDFDRLLVHMPLDIG